MTERILRDMAARTGSLLHYRKQPLELQDIGKITTMHERIFRNNLGRQFKDGSISPENIIQIIADETAALPRRSRNPDFSFGRTENHRMHGQKLIDCQLITIPQRFSSQALHITQYRSGIDRIDLVRRIQQFLDATEALHAVRSTDILHIDRIVAEQFRLIMVRADDVSHRRIPARRIVHRHCRRRLLDNRSPSVIDGTHQDGLGDESIVLPCNFPSLLQIRRILQYLLGQQ